VQDEPTAFFAEDETAMVRDALIGILVGIVAFGLVTFLIVRLGWPDQSVGFAAAVAVFTAPWAGVFFGSAAGVAYSQLHAARDVTTAPTTDTTIPTAPPTTTILHT
jgi:hypothetical protein